MTRIKLYADAPGRLTRQLVADALLIAWLVAWVWVGHAVHDDTLALAVPGDRVTSSATSLSESMLEAGSFFEDLPLVGEGVAAPFGKASDAAESLADAGRSEREAVEQLAFWLGFSIAAIPILIVGAFYLPRRIRWVRRATASQRFVDGPADLDLFALRAMTNQPLHVLARVTDDPVGALQRQDRAVIARLADLELRESGLRAPRALRA